jgi:outer membrane protein assembly factor BamB
LWLTPRASEPLRPWRFDGSERAWGYEPGLPVWTEPALGTLSGRAVIVIGSYDHNVYALDAQSGALLWRFTTGGAVNAAPVLWQPSDPAGGATLAYAVSTDRLLYALDLATGERRWVWAVATFRPSLSGARLAAPALGRVAGRAAVLVGFWVWDRSLGQSQQEGGVAALAADTGEVLWRAPLGDNEIAAGTFADLRGRGMFFAGTSSGTLFALNTDTGQVLWRHAEQDAIRGQPAVVDTATGPRLVLASKSGVVRCLDAQTGQALWQYRTGDWVTAAAAVATIDGRDLVFATSYDRHLYALELHTGALVWRYAAQGGAFSAPVVVSRGEHDANAEVVFAAWDHYLHGVRASDGSPLWRRYTGRPLWSTIGLEHTAWSSPVALGIGDDALILFGSYDGTLYAEPLTDLLARPGVAPRSNALFWLSFPVVLLAVGFLAVALTRLERRKRV